MAVGVYRDCRIDGAYQAMYCCREIMMRTLSMRPSQRHSQQEPIGLLVYYMTLALHRSAKRKSADHDAPGLCEHASKWDESLPPSVPHA